jgi:hypothetical protein
MVFFAGTGEEKRDKGIPSGFGWTDCERSLWVWVFQFCPLPLFIEGGKVPRLLLISLNSDNLNFDYSRFNPWSC